MKYILLALIHIYKIIPGPWHHNCRHIPTCSSYGIDAIMEYGSIKGSYLAFKRILKCNPWGTSGFDPIPKKENKNEKNN